MRSRKSSTRWSRIRSNICSDSSRPAPMCCRSSIPGPACCRPANSQRWSVEPTKAHRRKACAGKVPDAKIIGFPRGAGALLPGYVEATGVDAVSIDWAAEPALIRERVQSSVAVQGNLDPLALIAGGAALDRAIDDVLANYAQGPADLQPRPRHPAGNPDRPCRADGEAGKGFSISPSWPGMTESAAYSLPRPRDDRGGTLVQQFKADGAAEFARAIRGAGAGYFDERAAVLVQHRRGQCHLRAVDGRIA